MDATRLNQYGIREARMSDAAVIASLVTQLGYPTCTGKMQERLGLLLARPDYVTLVAVSGEEVVGLVGAYLSLALEYTGTFGRLTGMVVDEKWRGRGIGTLLMGEIERRLCAIGARMITLNSGSHRTEAHQFYRKLGYQETGVRFIKALPATR